MSFALAKSALSLVSYAGRRNVLAPKSSSGIVSHYLGHRQCCSTDSEISDTLEYRCSEGFEISKKSKKTKSALLILAEDAEEMETAIIVDVLRRNGVKVTVAGLCNDDPVKCMNGMVIKPDASLEEATEEKQYDAIIIPGGSGVEHLINCERVGQLLEEQEADDRIVAAICGGPLVLLAHSIGCGRCITAYPLVQEDLEEFYEVVKDETVVHDGNIITSRGPITCFHFAFKIAEVLVGPKMACEVAKQLLA